MPKTATIRRFLFSSATSGYQTCSVDLKNEGVDPNAANCAI